ncbi:MAG: hypothetical protein IJS01_04265 [Lentisphaeria bacterium]|nr:hypothetical protein [Lentisphaeria bacterium]
MKFKSLFLAGAVALSGGVFGAEEGKTAPARNASAAQEKAAAPVQSAPVAQEKAAAPAPRHSGKPRIVVFPFTTIDIQGQHFRDFTDRKERVSPQNSLSEAELETVDEVMLGYVKLVDAEEERARRAHDRARLDAENDRNLARQTELADKLLKTPQRAVVIGAAYMEAALGNYNAVELADRGEIAKAYREMAARQAGRAPRALPDQLKVHGATHVLYGTVADLRTSGQTFSGYGVSTATLIYQLDVIVKIVELESNRIVFSGVFTGEDRELRLEGVQVIDSERFERLMKSAVAQAAQAIDQKFDRQEKK